MIASLVRGLLADSPEFAAPRQDRSVSGLGREAEVSNHPDTGRIALSHQAFNAQAALGRHPLVGTAVAGSADADSPAPPGSLHAAADSRRGHPASAVRPILPSRAHARISSERPGPGRGRGSDVRTDAHVIRTDEYSPAPGRCE
ncbi:hypothetical protein AB0P12_11410 [Streptomyces subrutilus]|uniref:MmyB family transcriptional regulator n=1 Tax=Streptomyces subrutilus TaxID=36818 RepID=UPI00341DAE75